MPLVSDSTSDIFSRPIDVSRFGVIYAGAQKNLGPSGLTVVIVREDLLLRSSDALPSMLSYRTDQLEGPLDQFINNPESNFWNLWAWEKK